MKDLVELSEEFSLECREFRSNRTKQLVHASPVGNPTLINEESGKFKERVRAQCPPDANAYSLRGQIMNSRYVQYFEIDSADSLNAGFGFLFRAPRVAYDRSSENNCIPGLPK